MCRINIDFRLFCAYISKYKIFNFSEKQRLIKKYIE